MLLDLHGVVQIEYYVLRRVPERGVAPPVVEVGVRLRRYRHGAWSVQDDGGYVLKEWVRRDSVKQLQGRFKERTIT